MNKSKSLKKRIYVKYWKSPSIYIEESKIIFNGFEVLFKLNLYEIKRYFSETKRLPISSCEPRTVHDIENIVDDLRIWPGIPSTESRYHTAKDD